MNRKNIFILVFCCLIFTLFSLMLHILPSNNTMLNYVGKDAGVSNAFQIEDEFLSWALDYHKNVPEFKKRIMTTWLIDSLVSRFHVRVSVAFVWINFFFTFLCGFLVYYLALLYRLSHKKALLSVAFYYTSFSVLLAYFIPIATYDEPVQYFFILLSLVFLKRNYYLGFSLCFALALLARETSVLLLPAIFFYLGPVTIKDFLRNKKKLILNTAIVAIPVVLYILYLVYFFENNPDYVSKTNEVMQEKWFHYRKNFKNLGNVIRTILSVGGVFLFPFFLLLRYTAKQPEIKQLIKGFWITFWVNLGVVVIATFAEESRLFALPLLLLFPVFGEILSSQFKGSVNLNKFILSPIRILLLLGIGVGSWFLFDVLYAQTDIVANESLFREYFSLNFVGIAVILLYSRYAKTSS